MKNKNNDKIPKIVIVMFIYIVVFYIFAFSIECYRHYNAEKYINEYYEQISQNN